MRSGRFCLALIVTLAGQVGAARVRVSSGRDHAGAGPGLAGGLHAQQNNTLASGMDGQKLSELLTFGLDVITSTIQVFMEDPVDVEYAFEMCQLKLWKFVEKIVPAEHHKSDRMKRAKEIWDQVFENAPDITQDVMDFRAIGDTDSLMRAIKSLISTALSGCSSAFPSEAKYFTALSDLIDGIAESWDEFSEGNTAKAVEVIWSALKVSVDDVIPSKWASDETYVLVMGTIDGVISRMSAHVLEYKRRILNSKVCYKRSAHRERARPSFCREGFEWDQVTLCFPVGSGNGAECLGPCGQQAGMCESFCGEGKACCRQGYSSDPAECDGARGFVDHAFTHGTSRDYHQCVRPGPNVAFTIRGCGQSALNGVYVQSGSHRNRPRYTKIHAQKKTVMEWSNSRKAWRLFIDTTWFGFGRTTLYTSKQDTTTFPTLGWTPVSGVYPAPEVAAYSSGEGMSLSQVNASDGSLWGSPKFGAHEASCDTYSKFSEKDGQWCLATCPSGFKPTTGTNCVQTCGEKFPADGPGVCGTNSGELMIAMTEMVSMVASGAIESFILISEMRETGVRADKLSDTINVFIEMGKPFARPQCPIEHGEEPNTPSLSLD